MSSHYWVPNLQRKMKFVALISGGKDSFFNIHHCISQGHELVALANLYPEASLNKDEIDSFMFQTVGHDLIENYSECLEVPLYRQAITGTSENVDLEYSVTEKDEIEDMYLLLSRVLASHPEIEGVSCGAILSHYQRTRVENVCDRLGFTSLAYLWQRNQLELMGEMCKNGLDARLIKVAAVGLSDKHLGKSITQLYPQLIQLNQLYDVHICGEGGEFETIVLDTPIFKKKKLEITNQEVVKLSNDDVWYLRLQVQVVNKEDPLDDIPLIEGPPLLEENFASIYEELDPQTHLAKQPLTSECKANFLLSTVTESRTRIYVSGLVASALADDDIESQAGDVFTQLEQVMTTHNRSFGDIQHINLLLSNMAEFSSINNIYASHFEGYFLPPSRICIQTNLNFGQKLQLSCVIMKTSQRKQGIHIRSRSYWAPQNIGPYSQSIVETQSAYKTATLSGQIPLVPSMMQLSSENESFNSVLSLQHLHRVKEVVNITNIGYVICFITNDRLLQTVQNTWASYVRDVASSIYQDRLIIVRVNDLPKGANVEWGGLSFVDIVDMYEDDDENRQAIVEKKEDAIISLFERSSVVNIGKGSLFIHKLMTNKASLVAQLLEQNKDIGGHIQVFTSLEYHANLPSKSHIEAVLVNTAFDFDGGQFSYAIFWKIEQSG